MELQPAVMQEPSVYYYFRPYVREALTDVAPQAGEDTEFYLVHLLGDYARSQRLFDGMGRSAPPLAIQLTSALLTAVLQRVQPEERSPGGVTARRRHANHAAFFLGRVGVGGFLRCG